MTEETTTGDESSTAGQQRWSSCAIEEDDTDLLDADDSYSLDL